MLKQLTITQKSIFISVIAVALLLCGEQSVAKIYKWRDANGIMQYSDKPPLQTSKQSNAEKKRKRYKKELTS